MYRLYTTELPQPLWWSIRKSLAAIQQHNTRAGYPRFAFKEAPLTFRDFPGEHFRMPMVPLTLRAGGPAQSGNEQERRPLAEQWAKIESALTADYEDIELREQARHRPVYFHTLSVMAAGAAMVRISGGWQTRKMSDEGQASVDGVLQALKDPAFFDSLVKPGDWDEAKAALSYYRRSDGLESSNSDYLSRVAGIVTSDAVSIRHLAVAGSSISAWNRFSAPDAGGNQRPLADIPIGVPGDRIERPMRVDKIIPMEGKYGMNHLTLFQDRETGARLTWLNSGQQSFYEGDTYNIRGTVKEHETREAGVQTNLTRVSTPDLRPHQKIREVAAGKLDLDKLDLSDVAGWFRGGSVDCRDVRGRTPLMLLSELRSTIEHELVDEAIEFLVDGGADVSLCPSLVRPEGPMQNTPSMSVPSP
ncbi:hypothetical protein EZI54_06880 [Marinobacter halodurans]|uniref:Uncharacterized protein n=1 Tax=Marinobacter halodurans TaxID=2528979 RepID=A0ABY1ZP51_9GAMM|nr:hypothetical protein [Marinobacter halodurans]TBW57375.1 hypothetical protein EZI54_06880 [Marinobacter halodurans]